MSPCHIAELIESAAGLRAASAQLDPRPSLRFPGWWLYAGERSVVHLVLSSARVTGDAELGGHGVEQAAEEKQVSRAFRNPEQ